MKVLFLTDHRLEKLGGIQRHVRSLMEELPGHSAGIQLEHFSGEDVPGQKILGKKQIGTAHLAQLLKSLAPDLVHVHGFASLFATTALQAAKSLSLPTVYTPHAHPFETLRRPQLGRWYFRLWQKRVIRSVNAVVVLTRQEREFFQQQGIRDRLNIIPNGISLKDIDVPINKENQLLFVGRADHNKRLDFLLDQQDFFHSLGYRVLCVTNYQGADNDVFRFRSGISDLELGQEYARSKVVLIPSKFEAFSLVALDALNYRTAILASDRVAIREHLRSEWFYEEFSYGDPQAFRQGLTDLLQRYDSGMAYEVPESIRQMTWNSVAGQIWQLYQQVLSDART